MENTSPLTGPPAALPVDVTLTTADTLHYMRTVVRSKPGERIVLVDNQHQRAYEATLLALDKHSFTVRLESALPETSNPLPKITLAVALIKEQRWDGLLQKATELGADCIQPISAAHSVVQLTDHDWPRKRERWHAVLQSAAEQCESMSIPELRAPVSVPALCREAFSGTRIVLQERGTDRQTLKSLLADRPTQAPVLFAIGPEGGWTPEELQNFQTAGFAPASLGARILRSETAAIAAMSAVVYDSDMPATPAS